MPYETPKQQKAKRHRCSKCRRQLKAVLLASTGNTSKNRRDVSYKCINRSECRTASQQALKLA